MATDAEKQKVIDKLAGPRYYRLIIAGYGGESAYMSISKEAFEFWEQNLKQNGDNDLVEYMLNASDDDCDYDDIDDLPDFANFLKDEDGDISPWFESHTEFEHTHGATYDSSWISVDEVSSIDYNSKKISEVLDSTDISELNGDVGEETDYAVELVVMDCCDDDPDADYIAQIYSSEKGVFFEGTVLAYGDFDPKKLKIYTTEYLNGEDTIDSIEYDGVEVENDGADTRGKGFSASVWAN